MKATEQLFLLPGDSVCGLYLAGGYKPFLLLPCKTEMQSKLKFFLQFLFRLFWSFHCLSVLCQTFYFTSPLFLTHEVYGTHCVK